MHWKLRPPAGVLARQVGGGAPVWCDDNNGAARREVKPTKDAVQILQQPSGQLDGTAGRQITGNENPSTLLMQR